MKRKDHVASANKNPGAERNSARTGIGKDECAESAQGKVSEQEQARMIAMAAYYRAERRAFAPGAELDDWLAAEAEIEQRLCHR